LSILSPITTTKTQETLKKTPGQRVKTNSSHDHKKLAIAIQENSGNSRLAFHGITDMNAANRYLAKVYLPAYNAGFMQPPLEDGSAFVCWTGENLDDIL